VGVAQQAGKEHGFNDVHELGGKPASSFIFSLLLFLAHDEHACWSAGHTDRHADGFYPQKQLYFAVYGAKGVGIAGLINDRRQIP
jgi:hypothetical protein